MLCRNCGKNPAQEYVRRSEGKEVKLFLCPECYGYLYGGGGGGYLASSAKKAGAGKRCPDCGTSFEDFRRTGLVGCAGCYVAMREELLPTIRYIQGKVRHEGKMPEKATEEDYDLLRLLVVEQEQVKASLEQALAEHDYAAAERYQVRLREINHKMHGGEERA